MRTAQEMLNHYVMDMLIKMISWYIGSEHDFKVSVGKSGKNFKKYLDTELYNRYINTYTTADYKKMWDTSFEMIALFGEVARKTAKNLDFTYDKEKENGILDYMKFVPDN